MTEPIPIKEFEKKRVNGDDRFSGKSVEDIAIEIGIEVEQPKAKSLRWFRASDIAGEEIPERIDLVPGFIPSETVTMLAGDGGTGKSLIALQLAVAATTGRRWLGQYVQPGPAVFITAEDDENEVKRRLAAIFAAQGVDCTAAKDLHWISLAGEDALLASLDRQEGTLRPTPLFKLVDMMIADVKPVVAVFDTLADFFPGNENDRAQARQFVGMLRGLGIRRKTAPVLLAHPSLTGLNSGTGTSGSTGWSNSSRSRLYHERVVQEGYEPNPDARRLVVKKNNYSRTGREILMTWRDGVFVADEAETGLDRTLGNAKAERVFLKLVDVMGQQGRDVSPSPGGNYAPKLFANHPDGEGVSKDKFKTAMENLLQRRIIEVKKYGPSSRPRTTLSRVYAEDGGRHDD